MRSDCDYKDLKYLYWSLKEYRYKFIKKRQNINQYRRQKKGTPKVIIKMINAFDRKINNVPIFTDEIKKEYLKGINTIFANYYSMQDEYLSRKDYYGMFWAEQYCVFKNPRYIISFKEFKEQGYYKRYYKK
jgi:hypothetical protein